MLCWKPFSSWAIPEQGLGRVPRITATLGSEKNARTVCQNVDINERCPHDHAFLLDIGCIVLTLFAKFFS